VPNIDALRPEAISRIDKALGSYLSRLLMNADGLAHICKQLEGLASTKDLDAKLIERSLFLRSCAYKLAGEGLILTSLIISAIAHLGQLQAPEATRTLAAVADLIHETFDPQLHRILSDNASYRHHRKANGFSMFSGRPVGEIGNKNVGEHGLQISMSWCGSPVRCNGTKPT